MGDSSSDEYHEDSLPDLVLSSAYSKDDLLGHVEDEEDEVMGYSLIPPDLVIPEEQFNIESEYFTSGDQVTTH